MIKKIFVKSVFEKIFFEGKSANKKTSRKGGVFFIGCSSCTIFELLKAHRSEVVAIREQIRYVRERLAV